ncbi:hypothetical protein XYCOK13_16670 [Xylanibacillus composti]|uniref:RelA/SpoT domain-containing protein n=1 Tax=Xylanibacillus composti TaxID=1572762 RepID=A0A8J4H530_9BACL|nr:GTP pyrophosphokinase family protein [Xylanibacillus composti]GIQ68843.1 hypothetical protein XYCOK13_16670 [Xylanibacillus composti]
MSDNPIQQLRLIKNRITSFMMVYKFALSEMETKIEILSEEFQLLHDYNPIEHTKSRLKSPESIMRKLYRKGGAQSLDDIRDQIRDIAGIRITCSFISDIYTISEMLQNQSDLRTISVKDYIANPKPNGYKSLHLLVAVPVFLSDRQEHVYVEVQIRTIAMDFWASLEHKIFYKYNQSVPQHLLMELKEAADAAYELDEKMERLHKEIEEIKLSRYADEELDLEVLVGKHNFRIPDNLLKLIRQEDSRD